jgi:imidazolonepropionase-like amidohydrolase
MAKKLVFRGAKIFDGESEQLRTGADVLVSEGVIRQISDAPYTVVDDTEIVECGGRVLMPGLIDAHVHVYAYGLNVTRVVQAPPTYVAHFAARFLKASLDRGFTSVRDVGGADVGLAGAIRDGLLGLTPRLFYGGRVISQTGGHGDFRPGDHALEVGCCGCHADHLAVLADGVDEVRRAVREELRRGASHIKVMASGGVASPTDPLERCQYSDEEIRAAVDEATRAGSYVATHCHPAEAIRRSAMLGVRTIEHCTLVDDKSAAMVAEKGAYAVPTMAVIFALLEEGDKLGLPPVSMEKLRRVSDFAYSGLEVLQKAGVKMGLGTDLLGPQHVRQSTEFSLRAKVLPSLEILRSACAVNAEIVNHAGKLGCVREGALADLLVVEGDPTADVTVLCEQKNLRVIMKDGQFHKKTI